MNKHVENRVINHVLQCTVSKGSANTLIDQIKRILSDANVAFEVQEGRNQFQSPVRTESFYENSPYSPATIQSILLISPQPQNSSVLNTKITNINVRVVK